MTIYIANLKLDAVCYRRFSQYVRVTFMHSFTYAKGPSIYDVHKDRRRVKPHVDVHTEN